MPDPRLVLTLCLGLVTPPGPAQQPVSRTGAVAATADIEIHNVAGSVRVRGWERNEVSVGGTLGAGVERLSFENRGEEVEIGVVVPRGLLREGVSEAGESHLDVMVPRGASLQIETLAASIVVDGVDGAVRMESSAGDIAYAGAAATIEADSAAGDVSLHTSSTTVDLDVEGVAGDVVLQFGAGTVSASTVTGSLRVLGGRLQRGTFGSVSGSLYFEGEIGAAAEMRLENFTGDVELLIPEETAASFEISTYSGPIETDFGYRGRRLGPYSPAQEARFTLAGGGAQVSIETFSGAVNVRRR